MLYAHMMMLPAEVSTQYIEAAWKQTAAGGPGSPTPSTGAEDVAVEALLQLRDD